MKLLMYGVNKETVTKEDAKKYELTPDKKRKQMLEIVEFDGIEEIVVLNNDFRNEYYLYVDELIFSHGDFLRYLSEETGKSLEEIILETYSKFNEDVLQHLYDITNGFVVEPKGCFTMLETVKKSFDYAKKLRTIGDILFKLFSETLDLACLLKLNMDLKPLNDTQISKFIYLLKKEVKTLENKNIVLAATDFELIVFTKILLLAGAQSVTISHVEGEQLKRQFDKVKRNLRKDEINRFFMAPIKDLNYRLAKADVVMLDVEEFNLLDKEMREEIAMIRQTKKIQYLLDMNADPIKKLDEKRLDVQVIDSDIKFSYNDKQKEQAIIEFEEILKSQIEQFMNYFEQFQNNTLTEPGY